MFNIGPPELIVLLLVALLIVGPKRLPEVGKTIGRSLREFRKAQDDLKSSFNFDADEGAPAKKASPAPQKASAATPPVAPKGADEEPAAAAEPPQESPDATDED